MRWLPGDARVSWWGTALAVLIGATPRPAAAAEPLLAQSLALGSPAREVPVELQPADDERVVLKVGGRRFSLPWARPSAARAEAVALAGGGAVLRVVAQLPAGEVQALVGGTRAQTLLFEGPVGLRGDPGERQGSVLQVETGEAGTRAYLRRQAEALTRCDGTPVWLEDREVDPRRLVLVPASPADDEPTPPSLHAEPIDALTPASPLQLLRPLAATDPSGRQVVMPPARLDDEQPETATVAAPRAPQWFWKGRLEAAGFGVHRLELAAPPGVELPSTVRVELGDRRFALAIPQGAEAVAATLPDAVASTCVTLAARGPFGHRTGIGELRAVTDLHTASPATVLAEALVKDDAVSRAAAQMLPRLGAEGARATLIVWPRLSTLGRRRALPVLAPYLGEAEVLAAVDGAAREPGLTELAVEILATSEGPGQDALAALAASDDAAGALALSALGDAPGNAARLLALLAAEGGARRARLREALATQARVDAEALEAQAVVWLEQADAAAAAALAQAIAGRHPRMTPLVERACEQAAFQSEAPFEERYRCALALARLPAGPVGDAWLEGQGKDAAEWMQRREALHALAVRESPRTAEVAREALADPTPRVRAEAALALTPDDARDALRTLAERDRWPSVRRSAVEALAGDVEARDVLRRRVGDPSRLVRQAAIEALTAQRDREAWPAVEARLAMEREFAAVRVAAIRYARELCRREAEPTLRALLERGLAPDAEAEDVTVAIEALRALRALGGRVRQEAEQWLESHGAPAGLGRAAGQPAACPAEPSAGVPTT